MNSEIHTLDVVALTEDIPEHDLRHGQVGTVIESLSSDMFEIEFIDNDGRTYATLLTLQFYTCHKTWDTIFPYIHLGDSDS